MDSEANLGRAIAAWNGCFELGHSPFKADNSPMPLVRISLVIYHLLKLAGIGAIAVFAGLIYQRMPLTYGEYVRAKANRTALQEAVSTRMPVIAVPGTVDVNVDNDSLTVELDRTIDVHIEDDPLPVTIER